MVDPNKSISNNMKNLDNRGSDGELTARFRQTARQIAAFFDKLKGTACSRSTERTTASDAHCGKRVERSLIDTPSYSHDSLLDGFHIEMPFLSRKSRSRANGRIGPGRQMAMEETSKPAIRPPKQFKELNIDAIRNASSTDALAQNYLPPAGAGQAGRTLRPNSATAALAHIASAESRKRYQAGSFAGGAAGLSPKAQPAAPTTDVEKFSPAPAHQSASPARPSPVEPTRPRLKRRTRQIITRLAQALASSSSTSSSSLSSCSDSSPKSLSTTSSASQARFRNRCFSRTLTSRSSAANSERIKETCLANEWSQGEYNSLFTLPDEALFYGRRNAELNDVPPPADSFAALEDDEDEKETAYRHSAEASKMVGKEKVEDTEWYQFSDKDANGKPKNTLADLLPENALKIIAQKSETPPAILAWLASHSNPHVRAAAAKNPSVPHEVLTKLADDEEAGIRNAIAENPGTCRDVLEKVAHDRNPLIAWRAQQTLNLIDEGIRTVNEAARVDFDLEPQRKGDQNQIEPRDHGYVSDLPTENNFEADSSEIDHAEPLGDRYAIGGRVRSFERLQQHCQVEAAGQFGHQTESTGSPESEIIAHDSDDHLHADMNSHTSQELVSHSQTTGGDILTSEDPTQSNSFSYVPMEEEEIQFLLVVAKRTNTPVQRLSELSGHPEARVRSAVAENANTPADRLWELARDRDSTVRIKVIDNINCPIEILEALKEDENAYVAYQAHTVLLRILGAAYGDGSALRTVTWP